MEEVKIVLGFGILLSLWGIKDKLTDILNLLKEKQGK
jgi:hypothetical protein